MLVLVGKSLTRVIAEAGSPCSPQEATPFRGPIDESQHKTLLLQGVLVRFAVADPQHGGLRHDELRKL